jgi:hypothetical protein
MIHAFKKCPSVSRPRGFFYYSETARLWIVKNWLTGDWFFEKESDAFPVKSVRSRQYFKTPHKAMAYLDSGEPLTF